MTFPWMVNFFNPQRDQIRLSFVQAVSNTTQWSIVNNTSIPILLEWLYHDWPVGNDAVFNFYIAGQVIWSSEDLNPPTTVPDEDAWFGPESRRIIAPKTSRTLQCDYGLTAAGSGYTMSLRFSNGWEISAVK